MVVAQGDIFWADLPAPVGSGPGFHRPILVIQSDAFNRSRIATILVVPLTSNLRLAQTPGNVLLRSRATGLPKDSVANVSQVIAVDRDLLTERTGHLPPEVVHTILGGLDIVLGREDRAEVP